MWLFLFVRFILMTFFAGQFVLTIGSEQARVRLYLFKPPSHAPVCASATPQTVEAMDNTKQEDAGQKETPLNE